MITDDPLNDFDTWCIEQERYLEKLPICSCCDNRITDDSAYYIYDEWICCFCIEDYRKEVTIDE